MQLKVVIAPKSEEGEKDGAEQGSDKLEDYTSENWIDGCTSLFDENLHACVTLDFYQGTCVRMGKVAMADANRRRCLDITATARRCWQITELTL